MIGITAPDILDKILRSIEEARAQGSPWLQLGHRAWKLYAIPEEVRQLHALQALSVDGCYGIDDLTPLASLKDLIRLSLYGCRVLRDLSPLKELKNLRRLILNGEALEDLSALSEMDQLQDLILGGCRQLDNLRPLSKLRMLRYLQIKRSGRLECAPEECPLPDSDELQTVVVDALRSAPSELASIGQEDNALPRIRGWQQDLRLGEAPGSTLKLFILGNGGVGKTQIGRRLRRELFDPSVPSTHGIQQFPARLFDGDDIAPAVDAHVWDFGGQDVYLGTHALFVDEHAIFLLCWNPAYENTEEFEQDGTLMRNRPLAYWLSYIKSLASDATPVIVVQTQCDREHDVKDPPGIAEHGLTLMKAVSCSAMRSDGMEELAVALKRAARRQLEAQGKVRLPQSWVSFGSTLRALGERTIQRVQFDALCADRGIRAPAAVVLEYLHRSGQVFWREGLFNGHIVLDQSWALEGVYAILERKTVMPLLREQGGRFSRQWLAALAWREHSEAEREHFLALMMQCQICFKVEDHLYVAPALLPSREAVETRVHAVWRGGTADAVVRLDYIFLHEGVLRAMLCGLGTHAGESSVYWAYGACFYDAAHESVVRLSSSLPDPSSGNGGWIRIEVAGGDAAELAEYLTKSIVRVSIGRGPKVEWEQRPPPETVAGDIEYMDHDSKKSAIEELRLGHRPPASGEVVPGIRSRGLDDGVGGSDQSGRRPTVQVGILTIRDDEFKAVLACFATGHGIYKGPSHREYTLRTADAGGDAKYKVAILRQIEQGNGEAQEAARDFIDDLSPELLLVVGIAGGLPSDDITLGDVVLSTRILEFSVEARSFRSETTYSTAGGAIPKNIAAGLANLGAREAELGEWWRDLPAKPKVVVSDRDQFYGPEAWCMRVREKMGMHFGDSSTPRPPHFKAGVIAASDRLVKDPTVLFPWITTARDILAIEMESAGVYRAARERTLMLAVRGLSDVVGFKRSEDWTRYACSAAACFARAYLKTKPIRPATVAPEERALEADRSPDSGGGEIGHTEKAGRIRLFDELRPEHRPLASGEPVPVYVSYAWDDSMIAWVDELERTLPPSLRLLRDKNAVRPGGWISKFMQDIGRAQHVVVVLSTKYLQSRYCMRELLHMHDRSLGDRAELMARIVPVVMEDLKISDGVSRLAHVIHWQERHNKLNDIINQVGIAAAGGAARDELLAMKDFVHRTDELLSWLNDVLMPRVRKGETQPTIQAVIEVLLERTAKP